MVMVTEVSCVFKLKLLKPQTAWSAELNFGSIILDARDKGLWDQKLNFFGFFLPL
jgi:hypothetical protein